MSQPFSVVATARQAEWEQSTQLRIQQGEKRIAALETQVRIMEKILEKLVTLHPEAQESVAYEATFTHVHIPTQSTSREEFYAHREAKLKAEREAEDLYLQRRRNVPLDPPSSADPEWDSDL